jgi:CheY-like chemotaxis protein
MAYYPKRILIVEDNQFDGRVLKDILESHGYEPCRPAMDWRRSI